MSNSPRVVALLCLAAGAAAQPDISREELKSQFEQRYPQLAKLKTAGTVGETWHGFVAAVPEPGVARDVRRIIEQENRDRQRLYRLIAEELRADAEPTERAKITPEVIAFRNARRNFENAGDREHLRVTEATWVTKKDRPWLLDLLDMKQAGKVGETGAGYVEAVLERFARDDRVRQVVEQENRARRRRHERLAAEEGVSVETVGQRQAKRYFESARPGVYLKRDGEWTPKTG